MDRIEKLCADRGMRMTEQRRVIARVLSNATDHPDVEELYRRASAIDPHISIATVYRTVRLFEEAGVVEKHDFGDGRSRYEEAGDDHHDHLIDTKTGEVIEFFDAEIERLKNEIARKLGYELVGHKLELYGHAIPGAEPTEREGLIFKRERAGHAPDVPASILAKETKD
ncbi:MULTISPECIES: Fur family transcriptional regulator [unclassified Brevundimonas]|uniref:Fur family transcriptional regulator n=1 Tax=unclassified Brevundimonas TaxID=2622653 RepID=UPI0025BA2EF8|nr:MULTISPECIES: Fur family transcriptional regulator [unclassified Brevundimonas]